MNSAAQKNAPTLPEATSTPPSTSGDAAVESMARRSAEVPSAALDHTPSARQTMTGAR